MKSNRKRQNRRIAWLKEERKYKSKWRMRGQRIWQPRPISYQAQGSRQGGGNVRGRTNKVQTIRRRYRGQSCSRQTEITEGESGTPPRAVSQSVPRESTSAISQSWEYSGGAIPR